MEISLLFINLRADPRPSHQHPGMNCTLGRLDVLSKAIEKAMPVLTISERLQTYLSHVA